VYVPDWKTENATARIAVRARNKISPIPPHMHIQEGKLCKK
jgi:hypothetical protein